MADDDTETQTAPAPAPAPSGGLPPDVLTRLIQQLTTQQPAPPTGTPDDGTKPSWTGLLGGVLGGGQAPGYQLRGGQADTSGNRALLNFGINTLLASGPHAVRPDVLSAVATGLQGAQESLGLDQRLAGAQAATAYQQGRQQQQDQLARIKEAIPLLTLQGQIQRAQAAAKLAAGGGQTPGGGGSIATGGSLSPFIATNLPDGVSPAEDQMVRTVIGEAANQGTVGQQAVAAVIKNRMDAGKQGAQDVIFAPNQFEPWNNPKTRATLEAIDPNSKQYQDILNNAVRPVMAGTAKDPTGGATHFFSPSAQKALGRQVPDWATGQTPTVIGQHNFYKLPYAPQAPAPGQTAAAAPPPAPGLATPTPARQPASPPGSIPPPPGAGARPTLPQPEAPLAPGAGGAQVAGPGGPTSGAIPPSPPGSAADVADIRAGMVGAGADPTTLAPGPGSMPPGPRVMVAGGSGAPETPPTAPPVLLPDLKVGDVTTQHPGPFATYFAKEYVPPPQTENFNPNLTSQERAAYDMQRQQIGLMNPADQPKAYADLTAALRSATEGKAQRAATAVTTYDTAQRAAIQTRYDNAVTNYNTVASELQKQANNRQSAAEAATATANQSEVTSRINMRDELRKTLNTQAQTSGDAVSQLQLYRALSAASGEPGILPQAAKDWLTARGLATPAQASQWSAQAALTAANNHLIGIVRNGTGFSRTTNMDLDFLLKSMPGDADQSEAYRNAKAAFLITTFAHQQKYANGVSANLADGMSYKDAQAAADKDVGSALKEEPAGLHGDDQTKWRFDNLENGQFYKQSDGSLGIFNAHNKPRPQ